jgi:hypothetical protein
MLFTFGIRPNKGIELNEIELFTVIAEGKNVTRAHSMGQQRAESW